MDLRLLLRVLWRYRVLVAAGFCLAFALTFISVVRVDFTGSKVLSYRKSETWISTARLFVTEPGFPWGRRLVIPAQDGDASSPAHSDPARFTGLAVLYSRLADSDPVKQILLRSGRIQGKIFASPVMTSGGDGDPLPMIEISATGSSKRSSIRLTRRASAALVAIIRGQQEINNIPADERVVLETIETPRTAKLLTGRPLVVPMLLFVGVMGLAIGLAFVLENLRPVVKAAEAAAEAETETETETAPPLRMPA